MQKIPTLFKRGPDHKVIDEVTPGCEWVLAGEGVATEKLDGTNVRITIRSGEWVRLEKRRNPSTLQRSSGIKDGWYVDANPDDRGDRWIYEAMAETPLASWPDGEHPCEAIGPKIQGNPLGLEKHVCVRFEDMALFYSSWSEGYSFDQLREIVLHLDSSYAPGHPAEGIVFHHADGRMAKIKRKDFA